MVAVAVGRSLGVAVGGRGVRLGTLVRDGIGVGVSDGGAVTEGVPAPSVAVQVELAVPVGVAVAGRSVRLAVAVGEGEARSTWKRLDASQRLPTKICTS